MPTLFEQGVKTIKTFGVKILIARIWQFFLFKMYRLFTPIDNNNIHKFKELHNKYKGKRIFILGNGPSLNHQPLYLLKDEYTMCFNHFHLMNERNNWKPNFYAVTDCLVVSDMADELNKKIIPEVDYAFFPDRHPSNINYQKYINEKENVLWLRVDKPGFHDNLPFCGINESVVNAGIQVAFYLGFSEIYIIGVDLTFNDNKQNVDKFNSRDWKAVEDDPNHFDPRYFGKGKNYHYTSDKSQHDCFKQAYAFIKSKGGEIFNAGFGGKLEAFPRVDLYKVLNVSSEEQRRIFLDAIHAIDKSIDLSDFSTIESENTNCNFKVKTDDGVNLIKSYILTHIPFGPYDGSYYFLKRKKNIEV